jgi:phospholipid transport system substrate-binding protein
MRISAGRAVLAVALALAAPAVARAAAAGPLQTLRKNNEDLRRLLREKPAPGSPEDQKLRDSIKALARAFLDYRELAQRSLAAHWEKLDAAQRDELVALLRELIERNYVKQIRSNVDYDVTYKSEKVTGKEAVVQTSVRTKRHGRAIDTDIDYRLGLRDGRWLVFDVVTDEVSLVRNYRSQFDRIIEKEQFAGLLKKMKKKLAENDEG